MGWVGWHINTRNENVDIVKNYLNVQEMLEGIMLNVTECAHCNMRYCNIQDLQKHLQTGSTSARNIHLDVPITPPG